jgi:hypothetical protein
MHNQNPHYYLRTGLALAYASGTADRTGLAIDMAAIGAGGPFRGARFVVTFGAIASSGVNTIKVQQSSDDAATDPYSDLEGTAQTVADTDDDSVRTITILQPSKRYVRLYIDKDTSHACAESATYELFDGARTPVALDSLAGAEFHSGGDEGTA